MQVNGLAWRGRHGLVAWGRDEWQVWSWPEGAVLRSGRGLPVPEVEGERFAVAQAETVEVAGARHALPGLGRPVSGCWWRDGVAVVGTGASGAELWWVSEDGPTLLASGGPDERFGQVTVSDGRLLVKVYLRVDHSSLGTYRVRVLGRAGQLDDATGELGGSVHQVLWMEPSRRVVVWSEQSTFAQQLLVETPTGWESFSDELRVDGWSSACKRLDEHRLVVPVTQGIRRGAVIAHLEKREWRWILHDSGASYWPATVNEDGDVAAVRRPVAGTPSLVSVPSNLNGSLALPELAVPPARILSWQGPAGLLEALAVTPTGPKSGSWPLVVDIHGGPTNGLIVGRDHGLEVWQQAGFAAIAPEYAAAGVGGAARVADAYLHFGEPDDDPNVQDILSAIAQARQAGLGKEVFLFGFSWGAFVLNRLLTTGIPYRAAVCWEGVADQRLFGEDSWRRERFGTPEQHPERWAKSSPITRAGHVRTPLLLIYGQDGPNAEQGEAWYNALRQAGVPAELWIYPGGHVPSPDVHDEIHQRAIAWFTRWRSA